MALRRKVCVVVYRTSPSLEVLLLKRAKTEKGEWHPVTGNVEAHEAIPLAAVRELDEETGLALAPEPMGLTHTYEDKGQRYHETTFAAKAKVEDKITLSDEHTGHEWVTPAEAVKRLSWPTQKQAVEALAKRFS